MKRFFLCLKGERHYIVSFILFYGLLLISFYLFKLETRAVLYPLLLSFMVAVASVFIDFRKNVKKVRILSEIQKNEWEIPDPLPDPLTPAELEYNKIIENLCTLHRDFEEKTAKSEKELSEYYTLWVHQIKTPISSMRLALESEDSTLQRKLSSDLSRIEQYVEMVLAYLRLNSESHDYLIKEYDLDRIIKQSVKKFSTDFINKKLKLQFTPTEMNVLTDEKWTSFVIEQILSNAIKYTSSGTVKIYSHDEKTLCIEDTGIGIAPEDLPRIFEKGYTGCNGRTDKRASGIGLYLCRLVCKKLGHIIKAESVLGEGTVISIRFERSNTEIE